MCCEAYLRKANKLGVVLVLLLSLWLPYDVSAALIEKDFLVNNDKLLTLDQGTNLEWLDLTQTAGLSYSSVQGLLVPGAALHGFRYASLAEVETLFFHSGINSPYPNTTDVDGILNLLSLMGSPLTQYQDLGGFPPTATIQTNIADVLTGDWHWFIIPDPIYNPTGVGGYKASYLFSSTLYNNNTGDSASSAEANPWENVFFPGDQGDSYASWLVRASEDGQGSNGPVVPEPSTLLLFWFGSVGIIGASIKRIKK
ncbi:MAG: PEP-CTERM sorting domain-containing protein [Desulfobacterales bacterium]|jgi:hypothetical protein|nr:PEP-CTERM sorting domain-containing protein [Desulfobacterales bacterium]